MNSSYGLQLYVSGTDLDYVNRIVKYLSSGNSTIKDIASVCTMIDPNMFKNEHFLVMYYMKYLNSLEPISKLDLRLMCKLTEVDKAQLERVPQIDLSGVVDLKEEFKSDFIVDIIENYVEDIEKHEEVTTEEYIHALNLVKELIKDLKSNNILMVGSRILNDEFRLGRKVYKGREDFFKFIQKESRELRNLETEEGELVQLVDTDYLMRNMYISEPLFPHPIAELERIWGWVKKGETYSVLAPMSVGKTTLSINYASEALIHKINMAIFISEMNLDQYIARIISIIAAKKYKIFLASYLVMDYLGIKYKKYNDIELTESNKSFIQSNMAQINNIEYIYTQLFSDSSEDLGRLHIVEELDIEDIPTVFDNFKEEKVDFFIVDHINGISSDNPKYKGSELTNDGYVKLHINAKRKGVSTMVTNHVPDEYIPILNDPAADKSEVRGSNGGQSTKSMDKVLLLAATDSQKSDGEMVLMSNKDRVGGQFFEPILLKHRKEIGLLYEADIHLKAEEE